MRYSLKKVEEIMITMHGKYNAANVMIDEIDEATKAQIQGFLNHPAFKDTYIAVMPDCHAGKGAVVGFTMKMNDYIIPNIVGVDIGCGMLSACFDVGSIDLAAFDNFIKRNVPAGFSIFEKASSVEDSVMGEIDFSALRSYCEMIGMDYDKAVCSIGSLGGGNHFIELGVDSAGRYRVTIHCGSRNFGLRLANYFQEIAKQDMKQYFIDGLYKDLEFLTADSTEGRAYIEAVRFASAYASANRKAIMKIIQKFFGVWPFNMIESVHNFIGEDDIIRKGATPAREGQMVLIPFNMKDGIAIGRGKGSQKYNFSAPHGAGRILSRTKARAELSIEAFQKEMADAMIFTTTANASTLDEAPSAYKDKDIILRNIRETVDIVDFIKPIYNFKASS